MDAAPILTSRSPTSTGIPTAGAAGRSAPVEMPLGSPMPRRSTTMHSPPASSQITARVAPSTRHGTGAGASSGRRAALAAAGITVRLAVDRVGAGAVTSGDVDDGGDRSAPGRSLMEGGDRDEDRRVADRCGDDAADRRLDVPVVVDV